MLHLKQKNDQNYGSSELSKTQMTKWYKKAKLYFVVLQMGLCYVLSSDRITVSRNGPKV